MLPRPPLATNMESTNAELPTGYLWDLSPAIVVGDLPIAKVAEKVSLQKLFDKFSSIPFGNLKSFFSD